MFLEAIYRPLLGSDQVGGSFHKALTPLDLDPDGHCYHNRLNDRLRK